MIPLDPNQEIKVCHECHKRKIISFFPKNRDRCKTCMERVASRRVMRARGIFEYHNWVGVNRVSDQKCKNCGVILRHKLHEYPIHWKHAYFYGGEWHRSAPKVCKR